MRRGEWKKEWVGHRLAPLIYREAGRLRDIHHQPPDIDPVYGRRVALQRLLGPDIDSTVGEGSVRKPDGTLDNRPERAHTCWELLDRNGERRNYGHMANHRRSGKGPQDRQLHPLPDGP